MAQVPWSDAQKEAFLMMQFQAQSSHYQEYYPNSDHKIILLDDQAIGRLYLAYEDDRIEILDIALLPQHRGSGIGKRIIGELTHQAETAGLPLCIYVETFNPSVGIFERLGFSQKETDGVNIRFEWRPTSRLL